MLSNILAQARDTIAPACVGGGRVPTGSRILPSTLCVGVLLLGPLATASADFVLNWWTISAGGGTSSSATFTLSATLGQPVAGVPMTGGSFTLTGGFWAPPAAPSLHLGDLNCDGIIDFDDINPFILALSDPATYQAAYPNCNVLNGDCNGDGIIDFDDINPFIAILSGGGR
jgi:hypothetical protein